MCIRDRIQIVQIVDQTVGIFGNAQHPLGLLLADDRAAAALTHTFHHFFVGQNAFTAGAPVDGHGSFIGQAVLVKLQENPLGPFVVAGVGGVHHTVPIEGIAQHVQLLGKVLNIVVGHFGRMDVVFDRIILRRQTERIVADGEQNIVTIHPLLAGHHIHGGIRPVSYTHLEYNSLRSTTLLRAHLVYISYYALSTPMASENSTLADQLIRDSVFTASAFDNAQKLVTTPRL